MSTLAISMVIGVLGGKMTQGRLTLNRHIFFKVVNIKLRLRSVFYVKNQHERNLDGIALLIVHF